MACTVKITGTGSSMYCYVTINGTKYTSATTLTVSEGTVITCGVRAYRNTAEIYVNGETVKSSASNTTITYEHTLSHNATIELNYSSGAAAYTVKITEEIPVDPMAPHDGHNTNIGQVAREIEDGTVLIGGVLREIDSGLVLAGGVAREIEFGSDECVITLSGSGTPTYIASVAIAGKTYYINSVASNPQIVVPSGTVITLKTQSTSSGAASYIKINGSTVYTGNGTTRTFTVTKNTRIKLGTATQNNSTGGTIEITEE